MALPFTTRVQAPKLPRHWVQRPRLVARLKASLDWRVQVVWAPAGYGKTTLLSGLLSEVSGPACWYSFLPEDREPAEFLAGCVRAVQCRMPGFASAGCRPEAVLASPDWLRGLGLFVTALQESAQPGLVFILDDVHHTDSKPELQKALSLLVERAPDSVHFLLASRTRPSMACLPRLVSQGEVAWLTTEDLRFTAEEAAEMLGKMGRSPATSQVVEDTVRRTQGWATGIVFGASGSRGGPGPSAPSFLDDVLFDYQSREVLEDLPGPTREFLLHTSVLQEFTPELCDALLGSANARAMLDEIQRRGLLLQELQGPRPAYKYHDLFREYLERRLTRESPQEHKALHLAAAALFTGQGNHESAVHHLHRGGAVDGLARALKGVAEAYFERGKWRTLAAWLELLPEERIRAEAALGLLQARVQLRLGDTAGALGQLDAILASPQAPDGLTEGKALTVRSYACRLLGKLDQACAAGERATQLIRCHNGSTQDLAEAYRQLASAQATQGRLQEARPNFEEALKLAQCGNLQLETLCHDGLGALNIDAGRLDEAAFHLEKARQGWAKLGNQGALAETLNNLASLRYYQGEFELALEDLSEAAHLAKASGYLKVVAGTLVSQGIMLRALGNYRDALSSFEEGLGRARDLQDSRLVAEATNGLGNCFRGLGEPARGEVLLKGALQEAAESGQSYFAARYHLSLSRVYCASGRFSEAAGEIEAARRIFHQCGIRRGLAEATFWEAYLNFKQGRNSEALKTLGEVEREVEALGYSGFLLAEAEDTLDLIRLGAAKHGGASLCGRLLLRAIERLRPASPPHADLDALPRVGSFALGRDLVFLDRHEVSDQEWGSRKARELLFFLLSRKKQAGRDELIDALYPEVAPECGHVALRQTIRRLRKATYSELVQASGQGYRLNPKAPVEYDVAAFAEHLRQAETLDKGDERRRAHLEQAIALYRGPFLPEFYSEWCETLRRDLEDKYHRALMPLAGYYAARGELERSCELLHIVLASDPLHEEANYLLVESRYRSGQHVAARKYLQQYQLLLEQELGCSLPERFTRLPKQALAYAQA
ncbi:MAG: tetratricopeptide repeat protein [Chloroflexi bacterium]|nr:tetratricopeptide repeat protein [Chloroflexota bacterium]